MLVWSEKVVPYHEATHFVGLLSEYLETGIREIMFPLQGEEVYIPEVKTSRFCLSEGDFLYRNLYIAGWSHFILVKTDLFLSPNALTSELRGNLLKILNPSPNVLHYIDSNYLGLGHSAESLGIHCRSGGHVHHSKAGLFDAPALSIYEAACRIMDEKHLSRIFMCGQDKNLLSFLVNLFNAQGVPITHHRLDDFPTAATDFSNTRSHVNQAVADLVLLSKSTHILSSANSTFGAVASLATGANRFILMPANNEVLCLPSEVFSGFGL